MDLLITGLSCFLTVFAYQFGKYQGKKESLPEAIERIRGRLTWTKNVGAYKAYRTLWPKCGYTSEDDAHESGFMAGWNAKEQTPSELCKPE